MHGAIINFNPDKGVGEIVMEKLVKICLKVAEDHNHKALLTGQEIDFDIMEGEHGFEANNITVVS